MTTHFGVVCLFLLFVQNRDASARCLKDLEQVRIAQVDALQPGPTVFARSAYLFMTALRSAQSVVLLRPRRRLTLVSMISPPPHALKVDSHGTLPRFESGLARSR